MILVALLGVFGAANGTAHSQVAGSWRLIHAANPNSGADIISIVHTADTARSDFELAGLMLQCSERRREVVLVVVTPFPPRARPGVTIRTDSEEWRFEARVVSPGAELLLPAEATSLAAGPWQTAHELAVRVSSQEQSFGGVIPIDGLNAALATLAANCPAE